MEVKVSAWYSVVLEGRPTSTGDVVPLVVSVPGELDIEAIDLGHAPVDLPGDHG
jgi:hypothetical protein